MFTDISIYDWSTNSFFFKISRYLNHKWHSHHQSWNQIWYRVHRRNIQQSFDLFIALPSSMELCAFKLEDDAVWTCQAPEMLLRLLTQRNVFCCVDGHPSGFDLVPKQQLQELGVILSSGETSDLQFLQRIQGDALSSPASRLQTFTAMIAQWFLQEKTNTHTHGKNIGVSLHSLYHYHA